jgi:hypothetical protein
VVDLADAFEGFGVFLDRVGQHVRVLVDLAEEEGEAVDEGVQLGLLDA